MILGTSHIRPAALADFDQVAHLISDAHRAAGDLSDHYDAGTVLMRLNRTWAAGGFILVTELDGAFLACGAISPASFARHTWTLSLGATHPQHQGQGLGHELVRSRIAHAIMEHAGVVLVSSRNAARWERYSFKRAFTNAVTGAHLMALQLKKEVE